MINECMACGRVFGQVMFDVTRAFERVHFYPADRLSEIEIIDAEGISIYCSANCRQIDSPSLMSIEDVPIPAVRPDIEPVETSAKCKGPVDMTAFHLTHTKIETRESGDGTATPLDVEYLAVVCNGCATGGGTDEAATRAPAELQVENSYASSPTCL
jgi:hypothetical protein